MNEWMNDEWMNEWMCSELHMILQFCGLKSVPLGT